jgi:type II secretory pathway pseudopilin PulG
MPVARRVGFTFVELLIVAVFVAVVTAAVLPQLSASPDNPRVQLLQYNLTALRAQIEHYKLDHGGVIPQIVDGALPQLTASTDETGRIGPAGPKHSFGPYFSGPIPFNPLDGRNCVAPSAGYPFILATGDGGWIYDALDGHISVNTPGHLAD